MAKLHGARIGGIERTFSRHLDKKASRSEVGNLEGNLGVLAKIDRQRGSNGVAIEQV